MIFINEPNSCNLVFTVDKKSTMAKNLNYNPKLALAIDITHPSNPFWNRGIMITATSQINESKEAVQDCMSQLQGKYGLSTIAKIFGIDTIQNFVTVTAQPFKIVYWKGPYFKKFNCKSKARKLTGTDL